MRKKYQIRRLAAAINDSIYTTVAKRTWCRRPSGLNVVVDESYRRDIFALENDAVFDVVGVTTSNVTTKYTEQFTKYGELIRRSKIPGLKKWIDSWTILPGAAWHIFRIITQWLFGVQNERINFLSKRFFCDLPKPVCRECNTTTNFTNSSKLYIYIIPKHYIHHHVAICYSCSPCYHCFCQWRTKSYPRQLRQVNRRQDRLLKILCTMGKSCVWVARSHRIFQDNDCRL